jgi:hypothetical protein
METLYQVLKPFYDFMQAGPGLLAFFAWVLVLTPPLVFVHEFGHAIAARWLGGGMVVIIIGRGRNLATFRIGTIVVDLNMWFRPTHMGGQALGDTRGLTPWATFWVALAGPAASLGTGLLFLSLFSGAADSGAVHDLLWVAAFDSLGTAVVCLIPMTLQERRGGPTIRTDGQLALDAIRPPASAAG